MNSAALNNEPLSHTHTFTLLHYTSSVRQMFNIFAGFHHLSGRNRPLTALFARVLQFPLPPFHLVVRFILYFSPRLPDSPSLSLSPQTLLILLL